MVIKLNKLFMWIEIVLAVVCLIASWITYEKYFLYGIPLFLTSAFICYMLKEHFEYQDEILTELQKLNEKK